MRQFELIGGSRDGQIQTILHGRKVITPKLITTDDALAQPVSPDGTAPLPEMEHYTITFVPRLNREALVLDGLGELGVDRVLAARKPLPR